MRCLLLLVLTGGLIAPLAARAALQFDVFPGYDGVARESSWVPVVCEVANDGPSFPAVIELSMNYGRDLIQRVPVDLPTNTRKRIVIPVFSSRYFGCSARLLDQRGDVRAEHANLKMRRTVARIVPVVGALPRTINGLPVLPESKARQPEWQPAVVHIQAGLFPDTPMALEGLDAFYLNSTRALELQPNQARALTAWVESGGHLILAVEQPSDVNATPWLRSLAPCDFTGVTTLSIEDEIETWLRTEVQEPWSALSPVEKPVMPRASGRPKLSPAVARRYNLQNTPAVQPTETAPASAVENPMAKLSRDPAVAGVKLAVAEVAPRDAKVLLAAQGAPLILVAPRGRGQVTVLAFNPEREPFRNWKNRNWFWARITQIPTSWWTTSDFSLHGGLHLDSILGALLDSRQVRKLPVAWLLLLLVAYLCVIGPVDQMVLKKLNRQMLTWITFPIYVVLFSLLIYFIGYKLRAGESEWTELNLVDVFPRGDKAELHGRTYASIYSPANTRYPLASDQIVSALRSEYAGGRGQQSVQSVIEHRGNGYRAELFVPVWTSQLFVTDWWQPAAAPLQASASLAGNQLVVSLTNRLARPLIAARMVVRDRLFDLGELPAGPTARTFALTNGVPLAQFVANEAAAVVNAVQQRQNVFGSQSPQRLDNAPLTATVASFFSFINQSADSYQRFTGPAGMDLTFLVERGDAVVLAFDAGHSPARPLNQFTPRRLKRDTLFRLSFPLTAP